MTRPSPTRLKGAVGTLAAKSDITKASAREVSPLAACEQMHELTQKQTLYNSDCDAESRMLASDHGGRATQVGEFLGVARYSIWPGRLRIRSSRDGKQRW